MTDSLPTLAERYLEWLAERHYSPETIDARKRYLRSFLEWCDERGITGPDQLSRQTLELYQRHLANKLKDDGAHLAVQTQRGYLAGVAGFCRWLARNRLVLYNPAAELVLPRQSNRIPRNVLTIEEAERVLNVPDVETDIGIRDRAMLETFYSTGIRRAELAGLEIGDLDPDRGVVLIREGKGRKDRVVPIGERALAWITKYVNEVRPLYVVPPDEGDLFLTRFGKAFVPNGVSEMVSAAVKKSGVGKRGSAHLFRHTMATLMLEGGADIRFIQQMLGHECLSTTQIYTRVSIRALKETHEATHPGAHLNRPGDREAPIVIDGEDD